MMIFTAIVFTVLSLEVVTSDPLTIPWDKCSNPFLTNICFGLKGETAFLGPGDGCFGDMYCEAGVIGWREQGIIRYFMFVPASRGNFETKTFFTISTDMLVFESPDKFIADTSPGSLHFFNNKVFVVGSTHPVEGCSVDITNLGVISKSLASVKTESCARIQDVSGKSYDIFTFVSSRVWPNLVTQEGSLWFTDSQTPEEEIHVALEPAYAYLFDLIREAEHNSWQYRILVSLPTRAQLFQKDFVRNVLTTEPVVTQTKRIQPKINYFNIRAHILNDKNNKGYELGVTSSRAKLISNPNHSLKKSSDADDEELIVVSFRLVFQGASMILAVFLAYRSQIVCLRILSTLEYLNKKNKDMERFHQEQQEARSQLAQQRRASVRR